MFEVRKIYEHIEIDLDGSGYWSKNRDVISIHGSNLDDIKKIFNYYEKQVNQNSYYIIGNKFYFTYKDIKYYAIISDFDSEAEIIDDLIIDLNKLGCKDYYYNPGRLD